MTSKVKEFSHEFDVGAREFKAFISIFVLAQATIFSGVHPAWTKHGLHTGHTYIDQISSVNQIIRLYAN